MSILAHIFRSKKHKRHFALQGLLERGMGKADNPALEKELKGILKERDSKF